MYGSGEKGWLVVRLLLCSRRDDKKAIPDVFELFSEVVKRHETMWEHHKSPFPRKLPNNYQTTTQTSSRTTRYVLVICTRMLRVFRARMLRAW